MKKKMKLKDIIENQYRIKLKMNILSLYYKNLKTIRQL